MTNNFKSFRALIARLAARLAARFLARRSHRSRETLAQRRARVHAELAAYVEAQGRAG